MKRSRMYQMPGLGGIIVCGTLSLLLVPEPAHAVLIEVGDFVSKVEALEDLTFTSGSGLYVAPTPADRNQFAALAATLMAEDLVAADALAAALNYDVIQFTDNVSGDVYHGLTEKLVMGAPTRGWGSFFVNFNPDTTALIQAPHPRFDTNSPEIAARIFRQAGSLGFLLAGAHRNANGAGTADVAHLATSIFQEVHMAWNGLSGEHMAWSIHGFDDANHAFPAGTDAVLSNGDGSVSTEVVALDAEFEASNFLTFAYNTLPALDPLNVTVNGVELGTTFSSLGGTTNVQGIYSRDLGGRFLQIEMEQSIRFSAPNRLLAANAIANAILATSLVPEPSSAVLALVGFSAIAAARKRTRRHQGIRTV